MLPFLLLVAGVLYVISESFAFKPMSRLAQVGIPTYSMVMALVTLARDPAQLPWLAVVAPVGVLIGWLQATHVQVRVTGDTDKHRRHIVEVRRGWTYALGWVLVFAAGIGFHGVLQGAMPWDEILEDLARDVERDLFTILLFTSGLSWYVYALSGTAGYTYALVLRLTNIHVAEALHEAPRPGESADFRPRSPVQRLVDWSWRRRGEAPISPKPQGPQPLASPVAQVDNGAQRDVHAKGAHKQQKPQD